MRGAKRYSWLLVLAMMIVMSTVHAQSSRIAFQSDQTPSNNLDIWFMPPSGTPQTQLTNESKKARGPSICPDGKQIFYTVGDTVQGGDGAIGGNLWVKELTAGPPLTPVLDCEAVVEGPESDFVCMDVDCTAPVPLSNNPRIVYRVSGGGADNIWMATWNVAAQRLEPYNGENKLPGFNMTNDESSLFDNKNINPTWCGFNHIVWSRYIKNEQGVNTSNEYTICQMEVSPQGGPVEGTTICQDTLADDEIDGGDELDAVYPSCGVLNGQLKIAYAKEKVESTGGYEGGLRICTIDFPIHYSQEPDCSPASHPSVQWIWPTWSPGGTQIAFAGNDVPPHDFDIYRINFSDLELGGPTVPVGPDDFDDDDHPDWGPALLGL